MRISDWSSDVCSSDLPTPGAVDRIDQVALVVRLDVLELEAVGLGDGAGALHVVVERGRAVDGGLAIAEQVQVGAVQQEDRAGHRGPLGFVAHLIAARARRAEIGTESSRESVCKYVAISVIAVSLRTNNKHNK